MRPEGTDQDELWLFVLLGEIVQSGFQHIAVIIRYDRVPRTDEFGRALRRKGAHGLAPLFRNFSKGFFPADRRHIAGQTFGKAVPLIPADEVHPTDQYRLIASFHQRMGEAGRQVGEGEFIVVHAGVLRKLRRHHRHSRRNAERAGRIGLGKACAVGGHIGKHRRVHLYVAPGAIIRAVLIAHIYEDIGLLFLIHVCPSFSSSVFLQTAALPSDLLSRRRPAQSLPPAAAGQAPPFYGSFSEVCCRGSAFRRH